MQERWSKLDHTISTAEKGIEALKEERKPHDDAIMDIRRQRKNLDKQIGSAKAQKTAILEDADSAGLTVKGRLELPTGERVHVCRKTSRRGPTPQELKRRVKDLGDKLMGH